MHWQHHSCSSAVLDLAACQLFDAARSRFNIPPLPRFLFFMPLLPRWCSLCHLCHRWLWRHRYPVLRRSLSRHQPTACTCQRGELRQIYKDRQTGDQRPQSCPLTCLNNRRSAQLRRGHSSWIERVNLLGGQLGIQSLQDSSWLSKWSYTTFWKKNSFITLCLSKCCTSCLPLRLLNSAAWGTAGWRTQRCC